MNYPALLIWATVSSLIIFFVLLSIQEAKGFDYYHNFAGENGWQYTPTICFEEPPSGTLYYVMHAIDSWERELHLIGVHDYDYGIQKGITPDCDITIEWANPLEIWKNSSTHVGAVKCYGMIYTDAVDRTCNIFINPDYEAGRYFYTSITHELGHALGLGHRLPFEVDNYPYIVISGDVMQPQTGLFQYITPESLEALQFMYDYNGWNGSNNRNYTIPH